MSTTNLTNPRLILTEAAAHNALSRWHAAREVGQQVRSAREWAGVTRQELAEYADMSETTLARVESGARELRGRERAAVARGLGVSIAFLGVINGNRKEG